MLSLFVLLQVVGLFTTNGILTPINITDFSSKTRKPLNRTTNWQTILKDATFQSLIKHTGFTPSLDQKIETDRLLWEKIQSSKFLKKPGKPDETDKIKMGILLDMTRDNGQLEFRQTDRSLYNCPEGKCKHILNRLLVIWKIQKFEPNNIWIKIKIPKSNEEDIYEYTSKLGLKQLNIADSSTKMKSFNKPNWKGVDDIKILNIDERLHTISRNDRQFYEMEDIFRKIVNQPKPKYQQSNLKPLIIGVAIPQMLAKYNWDNSRPYYQVDPVQILSQFQKDQYDGFMPSTGPTGSPYKYTNFPKPISYVHKEEKYRPPKNFKPSVQLTHYSPLDPFYHEDEGDKFTTITTTRPIKEKSIFPSSINEKLETYIIDINTTESEINKQPTASSINVLQVTENGKDIFTTNNLSNIKSITPKPKIKTIRKTSAETYDYAPLYMKWGEKIKTNRTKINKLNELKNTSFENYGHVQIEKPTNKTATAQLLPNNIDNKTATAQLKPNNVIIDNKTATAQLKPNNVIIDNKTATAQLLSNNVIIDNINNKSPEEVVTTLTNIGVQNTTRVEGYPEISEEVFEKSNKLINKIMENKNNTDPILLIINRISQSYSYKTASGKVRNLKKV